MRIVSLVPSLTETLWDLGVGPAVVGVTKFCVHPPEARTSALPVGGTKDPDVAQIRSLRPDLVLADEDENKPEHLDEIRGFAPVHVTRIESVRDAATAIAGIGRLVGREHDAEAKSQRILERAAELRSVSQIAPPLRAFVPVWHRPLMTLGARTYMGDLLATVGIENVFADSPRKYFECALDEVRLHRPEAVVLPTEPYRFRGSHCAQFAQALDLPLDRVRLADGEALTWFGTRTATGLEATVKLAASLRGGSAEGEPKR